jgi:hypothetical protein
VQPLPFRGEIVSGYVIDKQEVRFERITAVQERRRSGASGPHGDRRQRRVRTRSAARRAAVEEARRG